MQEIKDIPVVIGDRRYDVNSFAISPFYQEYLDYIIVSEGEINSRIEKVAREIANYYKDRPYTILVVLKGAMNYAQNLVNHLMTIYKLGLYNNNIKIEYIQLQSYHNTQSTGTVHVSENGFKIESSQDQEVLVIEDIVDTGLSLSTLVNKIKGFNPKSVNISALLQIPTKLKHTDVVVDFLCFSGPSVFYVGYGLDYNQNFRDMQHLAALNQKGVETFQK